MTSKNIITVIFIIMYVSRSQYPLFIITIASLLFTYESQKVITSIIISLINKFSVNTI